MVIRSWHAVSVVAVGGLILFYCLGSQQDPVRVLPEDLKTDGQMRASSEQRIDDRPVTLLGPKLALQHSPSIKQPLPQKHIMTKEQGTQSSRPKHLVIAEKKLHLALRDNGFNDGRSALIGQRFHEALILGKSNPDLINNIAKEIGQLDKLSEEETRNLSALIGQTIAKKIDNDEWLHCVEDRAKYLITSDESLDCLSSYLEDFKEQALVFENVKDIPHPDPTVIARYATECGVQFVDFFVAMSPDCQGRQYADMQRKRAKEIFK